MDNIPGGKELINSRALLEEAGLSQGMKVVDFGCGRKGHFTLQAASIIGLSGIVYAVDILKSVLENIKREAEIFGLDNIKTIWADLEVFGATKIADSSVDFVMANNLFSQIKDHLSVLIEAKRILKNGGHLLITDWKKKAAPFGPSLNQRIDKEKVKEAAGELGFKLEKEWEAGPYHWSLLFKKG
jgi:ubiquinone/menaquinone biosynthesis C-methylase UbiE